MIALWSAPLANVFHWDFLHRLATHHLVNILTTFAIKFLCIQLFIWKLEPAELIWMCHIEDESSWTIHVKVNFALSHRPIWHLTGMPRSFKFLLETSSQGVAFIHLSLSPFPYWVSLCHLTKKEQCFLPVVINQKQPGALSFAQCQCMVAHTTGHSVGRRAHEAT